jgi:hypothetical protein
MEPERDIHLNEIFITEAGWRRLHPEIRAELRQALGGKTSIIGRQVLDVARDLCARSAYGIALALYEAPQGDRHPEYGHCGLSVLLSFRAFMGEDSEQIGTALLIRL